MKKYIALILILALFAGCSGNTGDDNNDADNTGSTENSDQDTAQENEFIPEVSDTVITDEDFDQFALPETGDKIAVLTTSLGEIRIKLFEEDAPKAVENFIVHSEQGYFDGVEFARVVNDFMIQGGSPTNDTFGGDSIWGEPFEDEFSVRLHNYRGALSMANSGPNTNRSQFFIVQAGPVPDYMAEYLQMVSEFEEAMYQDFRTFEFISGAQRFTRKAVNIYKDIGGMPTLDGGFPHPGGQGGAHTVFGQVYEGMAVVDAIASVETDDNDKPLEPVIMQIEIIEY